jgi:PTH1 family peptidyl-tRNA hydrolase
VAGSNAIYAVFGLGNPGRRFANTRHNAGAMALDILARRHGIRLWRRRFQSACGRGRVGGRDVWLFKPRTFMNLSGYAVAAAFEDLRLDVGRILVMCDDIDLPAGRIRLREKGSAGGHKGLRSIIDEIDTQDFARLRVGVGAPPPGEDAAAYVLSPFEADEREEIAAALERAAGAAETWLAEGAARAMTAFND